MSYVIPKNWHYCWRLPALQRGCRVKADLMFTNSCKYNLGDVDQLDWNKLIGVSLGVLHPTKLATTIHYNSVRVCWRYNLEKDVFELVLYSYVNGVRIVNEKNIIEVKEDQKFQVEFIPFTQDNKIQVMIDGAILGVYSYPNSYNPFKDWGWKLLPYFGGNEKAPHKMIIERF